jgi:hypothetical protein
MLMEYYQNIVLQDKQEKQDYQRRKAQKQPKYANVPVNIVILKLDNLQK